MNFCSNFLVSFFLKKRIKKKRKVCCRSNKKTNNNLLASKVGAIGASRDFRSIEPNFMLGRLIQQSCPQPPLRRSPPVPWIESSKSRYKICIHEIFCAESFLPMRLQVSVIEFVRYSVMFLRTIDGGSYSRFMRKTRSI